MCGGDDHLAWKHPSLRRRAEGCVPRREEYFEIGFLLSIGIVSWIRVEARLVRVSDTSDMDQQVVTVDQFTAAMASIQEALASLRQEIGGQQGRPPAVQDETLYDSHPPPPPPPVPSKASSITICITWALEITPPCSRRAPAMTHMRAWTASACMRRMSVDGSLFGMILGYAVDSAKFEMPTSRDISVGCPRLHLGLY
ncbi:hypothetical protein AAG906_040529 [Vitis piasezkii]